MQKLRKMLGDINSPECREMMDLIGSQSAATLAVWAIDYADSHYLKIYESFFPEDNRLRAIIIACREYLSGGIKLAGLKPLLRESAQIARDTEPPVAQAAARAVSTACSTVRTPTSALGFLFYGAAAKAYSSVGLDKTADLYDSLASEELKRAFKSLYRVAVPDEPNKAKINWNC